MMQTTIQPPSHPLEYRAIGRICGQFFPSSEKPSEGVLLTPNGELFDAKLIRQARNTAAKLDPSKVYQWSCYPKLSDGKLSFQLLTWREAEAEFEDVFSIRGLVTSIENGEIAIRVHKNQPKPWLDLYSNLVLEGFLPLECLDGFVDLKCCREGKSLSVLDGQLIKKAGEFEIPQMQQKESEEDKPVAKKDRPKRLKYPVIKDRSAVVKEAARA